jgi:hypothetical protein
VLTPDLSFYGLLDVATIFPIQVGRSITLTRFYTVVSVQQLTRPSCSTSNGRIASTTKSSGSRCSSFR